MTNADDRQQKLNSEWRKRTADAFTEALDAELANVAAPVEQHVLTEEELADLAELEGPRERPALLALAKAESEHIKEHDTRFNEIGRAMREVDAHRKADGRKAYNDARRAEYAKAMGRPVRAYRVPDSEQKRSARNKAKNAPRQAKLDAMTPEQRAEYNAAEAKRKREARAAKKV